MNDPSPSLFFATLLLHVLLQQHRHYMYVELRDRVKAMVPRTHLAIRRMLPSWYMAISKCIKHVRITT